MNLNKKPGNIGIKLSLVKLKNFFKVFWRKLKKVFKSQWTVAIIVLIFGVVIERSISFHNKNIKIENIQKLNNEATTLKLQLVFDKALLKYNEALELLKDYDEPELYADINNKKGLCLISISVLENRENNIYEAITCYTEAKNIWNKNEYPLQYEMVHTNLSQAYISLSFIRNKVENLKTAIKFSNEAISLKDKISVDAYYGALNNLGAAYMHLSETENSENNTDSALKYYNESLIHFNIKNNSNMYAGILMNKGILFNRQFEFTKSKISLDSSNFYLNKSLGIYTKENDPYYHGKLLYSLGCLYINYSKIENEYRNFVIAYNYFEEASRLFDKDKFLFDYLNNQIGLARTCIFIGHITDKKEGFTRSKNLLDTIQPYIKEDSMPYVAYEYYFVNGFLYYSLSELGDKINNLRLSERYYNKAKRLLNPQNFTERINYIDGLIIELNKRIDSLSKH